MNTEQRSSYAPLLPYVAFVTIFFGALSLPLLVANPVFSLALAIGETHQPNINASKIYQSHSMVLGNNIKNLIITIPNEAHEPPGLLPRDLRVANQPYFPQSAMVNVGTTILWFNGDVGHLHKISLVDSKNLKNVLYDSGTFPNFAASKPVKLNNTGTFTFYEAHLDPKYPNFVLNGTFTVANQASPVSGTNKTSSAAANFDTLVPFMVPANQQAKLISQFKSLGLGVDSTYTFKSIRGDGSEGCGDKNESLLVLTSSGKTLDQVISALKQIAPMMPCT
jgi:hypothetical protein